MTIDYNITVRSLGYRLELLEVRYADGKLWTLAELTPPPPDILVGMALDTLAIFQQVDLPTETEPRQTHFILGDPRHVFDPPADVQFIAARQQLPEAFFEAVQQ